MKSRRRLGPALVLLCLLLTLLAPSASAARYVPVAGSGSTWSAPAISQWISNISQYNITVNYAANGSSNGRSQFRQGATDFGVSEIPYGLKDGNSIDTVPTNRSFAYMPIVAGGTSLMYNLRIGSRKVTNLRLSGDTVTKIFTGVITDWAHPQIHKDNPGLTLPHRRIVPVVRADGSGTTAQFSLWMSKRHTALWNAYCARAGRPSNPCGLTSNYPVIPGKGFVALGGSEGVAGFVKQADNVGTITYVEYSYALTSGYPVAKLLNQNGYYVEPTASNVAVGLLRARINANLTQNLDGVYANPDARAYPMSSYSYMILPTATQYNFTAAKGLTLSKFAKYFLCDGQRYADKLGYSPLPINLVKAGLTQVAHIPGHDTTAVNIQGCHNPTFSTDGTNTLAKNAPYPPACDHIGVTQCASGTGGAKQATPISAAARGAGSKTAGVGTTGSGGAAAGASTGAGATGAVTGATGAATAAGGTPKVDPLTGQPLGATADSGSLLAGEPVSVAEASKNTVPLGIMVGLLILAVIVGPPVLARYLGKGRMP